MIIKSLDSTAEGGLILSLVKADGVHIEFDLTEYIREIIADELGLPRGATLAERLALLRNDGGASL